MVMVRILKQISKFNRLPRGRDITKAPTWTLDVHITLLRTTVHTLVSNAMRVFYDYSEFRDLRQMYTYVPLHSAYTS